MVLHPILSDGRHTCTGTAACIGSPPAAEPVAGLNGPLRRSRWAANPPRHATAVSHQLAAIVRRLLCLRDDAPQCRDRGGVIIGRVAVDPKCLVERDGVLTTVLADADDPLGALRRVAIKPPHRRGEAHDLRVPGAVNEHLSRIAVAHTNVEHESADQVV